MRRANDGNPMKNTDIIRKLRRLHTLLVLSKRSNVLALALRRALEFIPTWQDEADVILKKTPARLLFAGYGPKFIKIFDELIRTGNIALIDQLQPEFDPFFCYLCEIPSIGETMARRMFFDRSIKTMDDLRIAYSNNVLQKIPAFGESRLKVVEEILWQTQGQAGFEPLPSYIFQPLEPAVAEVPAFSDNTPSRQLNLSLDTEVDDDDENLSNEIPAFFKASPEPLLPSRTNLFDESSRYPTSQSPNARRASKSAQLPTPSASMPKPSVSDHSSSGALDFGRVPKIVKARTEPSLFDIKPAKTLPDTAESSKLPGSLPETVKARPSSIAGTPAQMPENSISHGSCAAISTKAVTEAQVSSCVERFFEKDDKASTDARRRIQWLISRCIADLQTNSGLSASDVTQHIVQKLPPESVFFYDTTNRFGVPAIVVATPDGKGLVIAVSISDICTETPFGTQTITPQNISLPDIERLKEQLQYTADNVLAVFGNRAISELLAMIGLENLRFLGAAVCGAFCRIRLI